METRSGEIFSSSNLPPGRSTVSPESVSPEYNSTVSAEKVITILVVGHSPENQAALRQILDSMHCRICFVRDCQEALRWLCKERPPIVICDHHLPDGHWTELWSHMAPLTCPPCLIVASAMADERFWSEVLNLGGYDVLAQPFAGEEVLRVVGAALRRYSNQPEQIELAAQRRQQ